MTGHEKNIAHIKELIGEASHKLRMANAALDFLTDMSDKKTTIRESQLSIRTYNIVCRYLDWLKNVDKVHLTNNSSIEDLHNHLKWDNFKKMHGCGRVATSELASLFLACGLH